MLDGKARNPSMVVSELVSSLLATVTSPHLSVAERAILRETAFRSAQYIADNYFDNPNEAKTFMDMITKLRDDDILREKGWIVRGGYSLPYKSYTSPFRDDGYITPQATAQFLGAPPEYFWDQSKSIEFINDFVSKRAPLHSQTAALAWDANLRTAILNAWYGNEREVTNIISQMLADFDNGNVDSYLERILKAFHAPAQSDSDISKITAESLDKMREDLRAQMSASNENAKQSEAAMKKITLGGLLKRVEMMQGRMYSSRSWEALMKIYGVSKPIYLDDDADIADIEKAIRDLNNALGALKKAEAEDTGQRKMLPAVIKPGGTAYGQAAISASTKTAAQATGVKISL